MPGKNRHRKPTVWELCNRIYRQQLEVRALVRDLQCEVQCVGASQKIHALVAAHCERLLKENETLKVVIAANDYMARALPRRDAEPSGDYTDSIDVAETFRSGNRL